MSMEKMRILGILEAHEQSFRTGRCSCEEYGAKRSSQEHNEHLAEKILEYYLETESTE